MAKPSRKQRGKAGPNKDFELLRNELLETKVITTANSDTIRSTIWSDFQAGSFSDDRLLPLMYLICYSKGIDDWKFMLENEEKFTSFYYKVLSEIHEVEKRPYALTCILRLIQNIKVDPLRSLLGGLFSPTSWGNLKYIDDLLQEEAHLSQFYEQALKKEADLQLAEQAKESQRNWVYEVAHVLASDDSGDECFRICLEIVIEALSFLPTRRFTNFLLKELNLVTAIGFQKRSSPETVKYIQYLINYPIDDFEGRMLTIEESSKIYGDRLKRFDSLVFATFGISDLTIKLSKENFLKTMGELDVNEVESFCEKLRLDTSLFPSPPRSEYFSQLLWNYIQDYGDISQIDGEFLPVSLLPLGNSLKYKTMGYLSIDDLLWKEFQHLKSDFQDRSTAFISSTCQRLQVTKSDNDETSFKATNSSKYAVGVSRVKRLKDDDSFISFNPNITLNLSRIEVTVNFKAVSNEVRKEWDSMIPGSVLFLMKITDEGPQKFIPCQLINISQVSAKEKKMLVSIYREHTIKDILFNFIIRCNQDAGHLANKLSQLLLLVNAKTQKLQYINQSIGDYILNIGEEPLDLCEGENRITLKMGNESYEICPKHLEEDFNKRQKTDKGYIKNSPLMGTRFRDIKSSSSYTPSSGKQSIAKSVLSSISLVNGSRLSKRDEFLCDVINTLTESFPDEQILFVCRTPHTMRRVLNQVSSFLTPGEIYDPETISKSKILQSSYDRLNLLIKDMGLDESYANDDKSIQFLFENKIESAWKQYLEKIKDNFDNSTILDEFPFKKVTGLELNEEKEVNETFYQIVLHYASIVEIFKTIEKFSDSNNSINFKFSIMTIEEVQKVNHLVNLSFDTLILDDSEALSEIELVELLSINSSSQKRVIQSGDLELDQMGLITKFSRQVSGKTIHITEFDEDLNPQIIELSRGRDLNVSDSYKFGNPGFLSGVQFINVEGNGEIKIQADEYQNLEEAEYSVALFAYMTLLGYPTSSITIATSYKAQKVLIDEIISRRCNDSRIFATPPQVRVISDASFGVNDYTILSLVNTSSNLQSWTEESEVDLRRVISNSAKGLYILGNVDAFITAYEDEFQRHMTRLRSLTLGAKMLYKGKDGNWKQMFKLHLVGNEMFSTKMDRQSSNDRPFVASDYDMQSLEHFGSYVQQMTTTKLNQLKK